MLHKAASAVTWMVEQRNNTVDSAAELFLPTFTTQTQTDLHVPLR